MLGGEEGPAYMAMEKVLFLERERDHGVEDGDEEEEGHV